MAVTRRSLLIAVGVLLLLVCATAFAQSVSENGIQFGGWRVPEILIMIGIGADIGITLTRLKVVEKDVNELVDWRVKEHPKEVDRLREVYDRKITNLHARLDQRSGIDRRNDS